MFACICWLKSVEALQGSSGLRRNVAHAASHTLELERRLVRSISKGQVLKGDRAIHDAMVATVTGLPHRRDLDVRRASYAHRLIYANPILAGEDMLATHCQFLALGSDAVQATSQFRAFLHLYSALVDRQLLTRIPFVEELLTVYEAIMFTPSRAAASHGAYTRTYLLSSSITVGAVDALLRGEPPQSTRLSAPASKRRPMDELSKSYRLLVNQDFAGFVSRNESVPLQELVGRVADACGEELRATRVLSRDMLQVYDDIAVLFEQLCDGLGRRWSRDEYLASREPTVAWQYAQQATEEAVMLPLLPFLDALSVDGSVDTSILLQIDAVTRSRVVGDVGIASFCSKAASIIQRHFPMGLAALETRYYTLPKHTDAISREFGDGDCTAKTQNPLREEHFNQVMDVLEDATGPLRGAALEQVKTLIKSDPELLLMVSGLDELATILHHAVAGPARDLALLEWLIQMGALHWQPSGHFRNGPAQRDPVAAIDKLALHSAAAIGNVEAVVLLLEADNMRDLNTRTYRNKESLAHVAVKHGHRQLYQVLVVLGADIRGRSEDGKRVSDLTEDREWKREIVTTLVGLERRYQDIEAGHYTGHAVSYHPLQLAPSQVVPPLIVPSTVAATASPEISSTVSKKAKKKKKKKTKKSTSSADGTPTTESTATTGPVDAAGVLQALERLSLGPNTVDAEVVRQSAPLLATVIGTRVTEQKAETAVKIIRHLQAAVESIRTVKTTPQPMRLTVATAAASVILLLDNFSPSSHHKVSSSDASTVPAIEQLRRLSQVSDAFTAFTTSAARLFATCEQYDKARGLLDLTEKRLLALTERPLKSFRRWVKLYAATRKICGLGQTSSPDAMRQLDWYINDLTRSDDEFLELMDGLYGHRAYFAIACSSGRPAYNRFCRAFLKYPGTERVVLFSENVVFGYDEREEGTAVMEAHRAAARETNVHFYAESLQSHVSSIQIDKYEISETGIVVVGDD